MKPYKVLQLLKRRVSKLFKFILYPNDEEFFWDLVEFLYNHNKNYWDKSLSDKELSNNLEIIENNIMDYIDTIEIPLDRKESE